MADQYLGEIRIVSFNFAPKGWAFCNGQLLSIQQNQALFALLGTTYGGNGTQTFALPNLQGSAPMHMGAGYVEGQKGGEVSHTLTIPEMAGHNHPVNAIAAGAGASSPSGNLPASPSSATFYAPTADTTMNVSVVQNMGGSQPHENMPPYLVLNFCISLVGIFPTRN